jgi:hypothetical protein
MQIIVILFNIIILFNNDIIRNNLSITYVLSHKCFVTVSECKKEYNLLKSVREL